MERNESFVLDVRKQQSEKLRKKVESLFNNHNINENQLPTTMYDSEKPFSLAFVGQYSAGKSTIIKALTGIDDIPIGAKITTQKTHEYNWNDFIIIDTPGIHTEVRPDHNDITYQAIDRADIIIYVVTYELFESHIGKNFRKLLTDRELSHKLMLVVNKMANVGNNPEIQNNKLKDLKNMTLPSSPEMLHTCFIDAQSYIESQDEEDDEIKKALADRSNYDIFIQTINKFVKEKGLLAQFTTPLHTIISILEEEIKKLDTSSEESTVEGIEEMRLRERKIIVDNQRSTEQEVRMIYNDALVKIRDLGHQLANKLTAFNSEEEAHVALEGATQEVQQITENCMNEIKQSILNNNNVLSSDLEKLETSEFSITLENRIQDKMKDKNSTVYKLFSEEGFGKIGKHVVSGTIGDSAKTGYSQISGSLAHDIVKKTGKILGHKFKPYEAIKIVKGFQNFGKVIGVAGVAISIFLQFKEDADEAKIANQMKENRENIRFIFNEVATELQRSCESSLRQIVKESFQVKIDEIDQAIYKIREQKANKSKIYKLLHDLQNESKDLISQINNDL